MIDQIITFETGILARQKNFNIPCWDYINDEGDEDSVLNFIGDTFKEKLKHAKGFVRFWLPTQSLLQRWLREVHNIHLEVAYIVDYKDKRHYEISGSYLYGNSGFTWIDFEKVEFETYEEALEIGLQTALNLIK